MSIGEEQSVQLET